MAESKSQARVINNFDRLGCTRERGFNLPAQRLTSLRRILDLAF